MIGRSPGRRFVLFLPLFLAACGGLFRDASQPACPQVELLRDAASLVRFMPGGGRDLTDVLFNADVQDVQVICDWSEEAVEIELVISMFVVRGPANTDRQAEFAYFLAVSDTSGALIEKKTYPIAAAFEGNRTRVFITTERGAKVDIVDLGRNFDYQFYVGLQLEADELDYIRSQLPQ